VHSFRPNITPPNNGGGVKVGLNRKHKNFYEEVFFEFYHAGEAEHAGPVINDGAWCDAGDNGQ
jgi:hypothetical protein